MTRKCLNQLKAQQSNPAVGVPPKGVKDLAALRPRRSGSATRACATALNRTGVILQYSRDHAVNYLVDYYPSRLRLDKAGQWAFFGVLPCGGDVVGNLVLSLW